MSDDDSADAPAHHCHAYGCVVECKPEELMCQRHWRMVSKPLQDKVWRFYRPGQCDDKRPSREWLAAADTAIRHVREAEESAFAADPRTGRVQLHAISVRQPWADLIARGIKNVENRTWNPPPAATGHLIAIHASKTLDTDAWGDAYALLARLGALALCPGFAGYADELTRVASMKPRTAKAALNRWIEARATYGAIVAVVKLGRWMRGGDPSGGPWLFGPIGWELTEATMIEPVPASGNQYLWPVRGETLTAVRKAYRVARSRR